MNNAMIVAAQPEAAEAGAYVLKRGGNAVDAAVAAAFAQCVVDPLMAGIAGYGTMQVHAPGAGVHTCVEFCSRAPASVKPDVWADKVVGETPDGYAFIVEGNVNEAGYQSIGTLGTLAGLAHCLSRYGTWEWADVMAPAIEIAQRGFRVRPTMYTYFALERTRAGMLDTEQRLRMSKTGLEVFFDKNGVLKKPGDHFINPDMTTTLERLARGGPELFYRGEMAEQIAADVQKHGGFLSLQDLHDYQVNELDPIWGEYRGVRVAGFPPPAGGVSLIETLNVLENFDLRALGHNSPEYLALLAETMKRVTIDKDTHVGDPRFVEVPTDWLASKAHARELADSIWRGERVSVSRIPTAAAPEPKDTTQVCVMDARGNVVSLTHTLGTSSGVITDGLGFMYNGLLSGFDPRPGRPGSLGPGKSRTSSQCPAILFRDEQPYMVIGAPGGTAIGPALTQTIVNAIDFDMPILEAIAAPRVSVTSDTIEVSNRIPRYVTDPLETMGYPVARSYLSYAFAAPHAIVRAPDGSLSGAADPQRDGVALAVEQA